MTSGMVMARNKEASFSHRHLRHRGSVEPKILGSRSARWSSVCALAIIVLALVGCGGDDWRKAYPIQFPSLNGTIQQPTTISLYPSQDGNRLLHHGYRGRVTVR
jgi:hypothetical protein